MERKEVATRFKETEFEKGKEKVGFCDSFLSFIALLVEKKFSQWSRFHVKSNLFVSSQYML